MLHFNLWSFSKQSSNNFNPRNEAKKDHSDYVIHVTMPWMDCPRVSIWSGNSCSWLLSRVSCQSSHFSYIKASRDFPFLKRLDCGFLLSARIPAKFWSNSVLCIFCWLRTNKPCVDWRMIWNFKLFFLNLFDIDRFLSFWKEIPLSSIVTSPRPLHSQLQNHLVKAERFQDNRASRASCDKPRWLRIFLPALLTKQNQEKIINKCNEFSSFARLSAYLHSSFPKAESLSEQCIATLWSLRAQVQLYTHSSSSKCWLRKTYLGPKWHKMATQHVQSSPVMSSHQCIWSWRATHCTYYLDKFTSAMTSMCQTCRINPRVNMWSTRGEKGEEAVIGNPCMSSMSKGLIAQA